ncbi:MAG: metallophosphoesterase [Pseudomonadota bacterium]
MRLLLVSDLHYSLPQFDWVVEVASDFDIVVMAGDHLEIGSTVDGRAQVAVVRKYFDRIRTKTKLFVCSGNHDLDSKNKAGEWTARWLVGRPNDGILTDGESTLVDDTLFTSCPWWDGPASQEEIGQQLEQAAKDRPNRWIWIYHAPPAKSPIAWSGQRYFGDEALGRWIGEYQPDIVMCGHVHEAPFASDGSWVDRIGATWVFNTGHYFGVPPAHVILDTHAQEAVWFSAAGAQSVRLTEALTRPVPNLHALPEWLKDGDPSPAPDQA